MKLDSLSIGYKHIIVSGINAELMSGQFICLIGRNGTGKSTLLKTLSGLLEPIQGTITIEGRSLKEFSPTQLSHKIGLVLTQVPELPNTTLRQLVAYGRLPYSSWLGKLSSEDLAMADEAICQLGIQALADKRISDLSDGERQKAMIARALAQGTDYLILDEPSAFLDYESKQELMSLLKQLAHNKKKAILLSTHDIEMANQFADIIWRIKDSSLESTTINTTSQPSPCAEGVNF